MARDYAGGAVVITGGTRGLGKAMGVEFARAGATVFLTHRWGNSDEDALRQEFVAAGLRAPVIVESDASDPAAVRELMTLVREQAPQLDVVISNVAFAKRIDGVNDLKRGSMELSLRYSAWPLVDLAQAAREVLGAYPRYLIAVSSDGGTVCHPGYDLAGVAKSALETLCRYLALRLRGEGVRVNAIRPGFLDTDSARATFGAGLLERLRAKGGHLLLDPQAVARVCLALCSGDMDAVTGQVIDVDEGWSLVSPVVYLAEEGWPAPFPAAADKK
jgi:NAD(P)-dependent dehydrogenase (short-subunit alcohol dehydrogenase family)